MFCMFKMMRLGIIIKRCKALGYIIGLVEKIYVMVTYYLLKLLLRSDY